MSDNDLDIANNIRLVEKLKSELLNSVADLYSDMLTPSHGLNSNRADKLTDIILFAYFLAARLKISNGLIESKLVSKLKLSLLERNNILYHDSLALLRYITCEKFDDDKNNFNSGL